MTNKMPPSPRARHAQMYLSTTNHAFVLTRVPTSRSVKMSNAIIFLLVMTKIFMFCIKWKYDPSHIPPCTLLQMYNDRISKQITERVLHYILIMTLTISALYSAMVWLVTISCCLYTLGLLHWQLYIISPVAANQPKNMDQTNSLRRTDRTATYWCWNFVSWTV